MALKEVSKPNSLTVIYYYISDKVFTVEHFIFYFLYFIILFLISITIVVKLLPLPEQERSSIVANFFVGFFLNLFLMHMTELSLT